MTAGIGLALFEAGVWTQSQNANSSLRRNWMTTGMRLGGKLRLGFSKSLSSNLIDCLVDHSNKTGVSNQSLVIGKFEDRSWI
jgi:hypothetical protein